mgnify:CR=1 FL=1
MGGGCPNIWDTLYDEHLKEGRISNEVALPTARVERSARTVSVDVGPQHQGLTLSPERVSPVGQSPLENTNDDPGSPDLHETMGLSSKSIVF